ncbi:MAG: FecR domain-containing protein [Myxococcota bacterium]
MRSLTIAALSVIAVTSCNSQQPDGEWKPKEETAGADATAIPDKGDGSAEALPAGTQPPTSPETAAAGGSDAAAKPGAPVVGAVEAIEARPVILRDTVPVDAVVGTQVLAGDRVQTGDKTKIRIKLTDGSVLALGPRSSITMVKYETANGKRNGSLRVAIGAFWMEVSKWATPADSFVEVETPNAVAGVRGTTLWGDTQRQVVCALDGEVSVRSVSNKKLKAASLKAGQCVGKLGAGKLAPVKPDGKTVQKYLDEVHIK